MRSGRIKGTALAQVVADVCRLRDAGRISRAELEERLEKADRDLLEAEIQPALWYDNACHARLTALLCRVEGGGRDDYVVGRGADTADRLLESGLYQQLRLAAGAAATDDPASFRRSIRLLLSLSGAMYDFGEWKLRREDENAKRLHIDVSDAAPLTEKNRLTAEGFIGRIATRLQSRPPRISSAREGPDRVAFRIDLADD